MTILSQIFHIRETEPMRFTLDYLPSLPITSGINRGKKIGNCNFIH